MSDVDEATCTPVAATPATVTEAPLEKPRPATDTVVPPDEGPLSGVTAVTTGAVVGGTRVHEREPESMVVPAAD